MSWNCICCQSTLNLAQYEPFPHCMLLEFLRDIKDKNPLLAINYGEVSIWGNPKIRHLCHFSIVDSAFLASLLIETSNKLNSFLRCNACIFNCFHSKKCSDNRSFIVCCSSSIHKTIFNHWIKRTMLPIVGHRNYIEVSNYTEGFFAWLSRKNDFSNVIIIVVDLESHALTKFKQLRKRLLNALSKRVKLPFRCSYWF